MDQQTLERRKQRNVRCTIVFMILAVLLAAALVASVSTGSIAIPFSRMLKIIFTGEGDESEMAVIRQIRLPRTIMAAILGGALALSGYLLQTFFENPIAGPYILGISSGAKTCVALILVFYAGRLGRLTSWMMILAAFAGSLIVTGFVLLVSRVVHSMAALLVAGVMIGYICSAITDLVINFAEDEEIVNLHTWSQGSFSGTDSGNVLVALITVGLCFVCVFLLAKPIGSLQLGENYARTMGVNVKRLRVALILLSSVLSATVTAFAGPISFVGIAVPFLVKAAMGTARPTVIIPAAFLGGGAFCVFCDLVARTVFAPAELNLSTVTSIFGAPIVIYMLIRRQKRRPA